MCLFLNFSDRFSVQLPLYCRKNTDFFHMKCILLHEFGDYISHYINFFHPNFFRRGPEVSGEFAGSTEAIAGELTAGGVGSGSGASSAQHKPFWAAFTAATKESHGKYCRKY
jgi:hypothetical protein